MENLVSAEKKSYFDGGVLNYLLLQIVNTFIIVFTFGIGTPWAICRTYKWKESHTVINGKRLKFNGTAGSLFIHWIKWFLLTIITFGIYSFWLHIALEKWIVSNTELQDY